ncbi:hypothetical protein QQL38_07290 [Pseudomonas syringae]|uniref:hypothetical protein n=1 Tax=Pseudomonas syringae group TaxID=136849 RepID=UPI0008DEF5E1|nr:hypothetical protein [Pseudomonas syringae]MBD8567883.1 hypothetical protein [Pseudomonas syringae]MCL6306310.1 hypothetical protein [Pseudomonas syringae]MEE4084821.1 hypothetical protein [Pseudomonas viridiflava]SFH49196.1 hypothetical protein SAMN05444507_101249 [Pseudomonas syringae]
MKRKNVTEYAFGYVNSYTTMMTAYEIMSDGVLVGGQDQLDKCHIYIIATRPNAYFIADSLKHDGKLLSGQIGYKIAGKEHRVDFNDVPFELLDGAIEIRCDYPFRELWTYNAAGEQKRYLAATHFASILGAQNSDGVLNRFEVQYVGQAIGQGNRSAQQRLMNHSTFQRILALSAHATPDNEIVVFMFQFDHEQVFTSMDGRATGAIADDSNEKRLMGAIKNPPDEKQKIAMVEAGLIRYFQPHYNEIFKIKFPSTKHKTLLSCKALDVSALIVELDTSDLGLTLWSSTIKTNDHHTARFDLVNLQNRMSFFNATGMAEFPGVIKTVR